MTEGRRELLAIEMREALSKAEEAIRLAVEDAIDEVEEREEEARDFWYEIHQEAEHSAFCASAWAVVVTVVAFTLILKEFFF